MRRTLIEICNIIVRPCMNSLYGLRRVSTTAMRPCKRIQMPLSRAVQSKSAQNNHDDYHSSIQANSIESKWTNQKNNHQELEANEKSSFSREFEKPRMDASFLVNNYTAPALAAAYQDREYTLRLCAELLSEGKLDDLESVLKPYHDFPQLDRNTLQPTPVANAFNKRHLERIRKRLSRLPRQITKAYSARAAVVVPLCTFEGEPSVLFTLRSLTVGKHKGEVCFPGGMVDSSDSSVEGTCLRELSEEVGLGPESVDVLGVLRCDWSSVTSITGIAVTPVVGFIGEMSDRTVAINEAEVESLFTVSLRDLMDQDNWIHHSNATPVFTGGPHVIWGLTAYLLDICLSEVLQISN
ncbi:nudix hydrolase 3 [Plasmopara halstedii]|uniref:Nudix hydrolase 3 n=1 Tax=Plasmopara halstedii TaxID=4781 RepID=A0A0P1AC64_PLAHL|nr:nudix hydrolase 3 [Plasmopara halstedii]CEG38065.1 nudix hydrolase 3 [Plasmopara halstedii]|eukprot:XP_024574434.1 nudix hydrolase 3 [Plasmopara halstedii]